VGHQWLAQAAYEVDGVAYDDLLGKDEAHWSYLLDSDGSFFYGADWRDNGDGTFTAARVKEAYSALDLYLLGFRPKEKVPPLLLLRNPAVDTTAINREGEIVATTGTTDVHVDQLIEDMGPRRPDSVHSQKEFRLGFVFLTKPGTEPSPEDLEAVEQVRRAFGAQFFALTHGVAWADTTLVETPGGRALRSRTSRGRSPGSPRSRVSTARGRTRRRRARGHGGRRGRSRRRRRTPPGSGASPGCSRPPESLDFQARPERARDPTHSLERMARIAATPSQNADGGFGAAPTSRATPRHRARHAGAAALERRGRRSPLVVSALARWPIPTAAGPQSRDARLRPWRPRRSFWRSSTGATRREPRRSRHPASRRCWRARTPTGASAAARARPTRRRSRWTSCSGRAARARRPTRPPRGWRPASS
jgi:hypothetical protein